MDIYREKLELLDYVFFATVERGKVYETGAFIHNYALAYALRLAAAPYGHTVQEPHYEEELNPLNQEGIYLTPAEPLTVGHRRVQFNTISEGYGFPGKAPSLGYPDWGFARMLRPESVFRFYVTLANSELSVSSPTLTLALSGNPAYVRLGKFPGKARITLQKAEVTETKHGDFVANALLNWRDLALEPEVPGDIYATALPTRLIANPQFRNADYSRARFDEKDEVRLPLGMCFVAQSIRKKGKR
jgi:CRISPR-associated protein Csc1